MMVKTLKPIGNSLGLIIDRPIRDALGITKDTPLHLSIDGEGLRIQPIRATDHKDRVRESAERMADAHAETFEKLAS